MKSNRLMDMNVLALTPTKHQATVRNAGQEGVVLYELLVERDMARTHVKLANQQYGIQHVPFWLGTEYEGAIDGGDLLVLAASEIDDYPGRVGYHYRAAPAFRIVQLQGFEDITEISANFLKGSSLININLTPLSNVTKIQEGFLEGCSSLIHVDLAPLRNVTEITGRLLYRCSSLVTVDLSSLSNVTEVQALFLSGCTSLTSIDIELFGGVTLIQEGFLRGCSSLTNINLAPLSNVTEIQENFLSGCSSLTNINLSPLSNVTKVQDGFLDECNSLQYVDLSPLRNIPEARMVELKKSPLFRMQSQGRTTDSESDGG